MDFDKLTVEIQLVWKNILENIILLQELKVFLPIKH